MAKLVDQLKITQRDHEKLNSEFSTTVNKCNTTEFEYNQTISRLEEEISEALADKQNIQNKYEEEVFLLEGRVKEKEEVINELTQQVEELDFTYKNTRAELEAHREDTAKKDNNRNKLISELREQIEYHLTSIALL
jgi:chromosome segregation ATPase